MQRYPLTVEKFLDHAAKWHDAARVTSVSPTGNVSRISYASLRERCQRLAGGLLQIGLEKGERIATLAWDSEDRLAVSYAVMGAGLVCHTLNPGLSVAHLSEMINEAADRWIAVGFGLLPLLQRILPLCPGIEAVLLLDGQTVEPGDGRPVKCWSVEGLLQLFGRAAPWTEKEEAAGAALCFTSGEFGKRRRVLHTHRSSYLHTLRALQTDALALTSADTVLVAVPMFDANGCVFEFAAPAVGANMVLPGRNTEPAHLCELIVSEHVTLAAAVATVWLGLADYLDETGVQLPTLRRVLIGGPQCPAALPQRIKERLKVHVQTGWVMTEQYRLRAEFGGARETGGVKSESGNR